MNDQGEVILSGLGASSGGRRPKEYQINPAYRSGLIVRLDRECTTYTLLNYVGDVIAQESQPSVMAQGPEQLTEQLTQYVNRYSNLSTITFGIAGAVNEGRAVYIPSFHAFKNFEFKTYYEERFALRVEAVNDVNASVFGYFDRLGFDKSLSLVYIYLGPVGIGAAILMNGEVVRGSTFFAGEIATLPLYDEKKFIQVMNETTLSHSEDAKRIQRDAIGRVVATFTSIINPHRLIFSGKEIPDLVLESIRESSAKYVVEENIPDLVVSNWEQDYGHGLRQTTINSMLGIGVE
nr:ROK family protein [Paenibacillus sp. MMS18-CY102]